MTATKKKSTKKAPTLAQMQAVVCAWLAENHPDEEHVVLSAFDRVGTGTDLLDVVGPPTDKAWHTNDIRMTAEELEVQTREIDRMGAKREKERAKEKELIRKADEADPKRRAAVWLARWTNAVAILNELYEEFTSLEKAADERQMRELWPLRVKVANVGHIARVLDGLSTEALTPPIRGDLRMLAGA